MIKLKSIVILLIMALLMGCQNNEELVFTKVSDKQSASLNDYFTVDSFGEVVGEQFQAKFLSLVRVVSKSGVITHRYSLMVAPINSKDLQLRTLAVDNVITGGMLAKRGMDLAFGGKSAEAYIYIFSITYEKIVNDVSELKITANFDDSEESLSLSYEGLIVSYRLLGDIPKEREDLIALMDDKFADSVWESYLKENNYYSLSGYCGTVKPGC